MVDGSDAPSAGTCPVGHCPACAESVATHRYGAETLPGRFWIDARRSRAEAVFAGGRRVLLDTDLCARCDTATDIPP